MMGSEALETVIGVTFIFVFVSVIASAIGEGIENLLKRRASDLERGIREILNDPTGTTITRQLFQHPMISALFAGEYKPEKLVKSRDLLRNGLTSHMPVLERRNLPSYIPGANFAEALIDTVARGATGVASAVALDGPLSVNSLRATALTLPNDKLKRAFISALDYAEGDLEQVKKNIESWYDSSMDRVSGWYKRRSQGTLFVIGFLAAVALNVDTITVVREVSRQDTLRTALVEQAQRLVACDGTSDACKVDGVPVKLKGKTIEDLTKELNKIGGPTGWENGLPAPQARALGCTGTFLECFAKGGNPALLLILVFGWLITAFATMLGAPFWFDILNKLVSLRGSLKAASSSEAPPTSPPAPAGSPGPRSDGRSGKRPPGDGSEGESEGGEEAYTPNAWKSGKEGGVL